MDKPNQPYPNPPATTALSTPQFMPPLIQDPSIRIANFDQLLAQRGIRVIHSKAIPCPNLQSLNTNAHEPNCTFCNKSGMIFYDEKEIWGIFQSNSLEKTFETHGVWEVGSAVMTFPTTYPDGEQADFNTFDRLVFPDFTARTWEKKEYEPRPDNIQKLRYPIQKITQMFSITNNIRKDYVEGVNFNLVDGYIQWIPGNTPFYSESKDVGEVISIAYYTNPVYNVVQLLRELRVTQEMINGQKQAVRAPQQVLVKRDFISNEKESLGIAGT